MSKLTVIIEDELDRKFRIVIAENGGKHGNLKIAIENAIELWLEKYGGWVFDKKLAIDEYHKFVDINYQGLYGNPAFTLSPGAISQFLIVPPNKAYKAKLTLISKEGGEVSDDAEIILSIGENKYLENSKKEQQRGHYSDFKNGVELKPFELRHNNVLIAYVKDKEGNDIHLSKLTLLIEADLHIKKQDSIGEAFGLR